MMSVKLDKASSDGGLAQRQGMAKARNEIQLQGNSKNKKVC